MFVSIDTSCKNIPANLYFYTRTLYLLISVVFLLDAYNVLTYLLKFLKGCFFSVWVQVNKLRIGWLNMI